MPDTSGGDTPIPPFPSVPAIIPDGSISGVLSARQEHKKTEESLQEQGLPDKAENYNKEQDKGPGIQTMHRLRSFQQRNTDNAQ